MELIDQHTKAIMEACKKTAQAHGLKISGETLEFILTNANLIEISPKVMIPTLYDYWLDDIEVIRNKWVYDVAPHNPYETVINTRPAISFYNDNNPDWLNVMIFYHVLAHIDFFQNNIFFRGTWDDDFCGQALADKRLINHIREEMGDKKRWVDYVIEFARGIDNLVGYYQELNEIDRRVNPDLFSSVSERSDFYFGEFLRKRYENKEIELREYYDEIDRYNECIKKFGERGEDVFFGEMRSQGKHLEFSSLFEKRKKENRVETKDIMEYLMENSEFLKKDENIWMKQVIQVVRKTSLYFQPQIRTKIINEGWASYWHEKLFLGDEAMKSHEAVYATVNAHVMFVPRAGLNVYALGKLLLEYIEELARKGKLSYNFQLMQDVELRNHYDKQLGEQFGRDFLFGVRRNLNDFMLINFLSDDDFQDFVNRNNLFVVGQRMNMEKGVVEIYIKSRNGKAYRQMLNDKLYHPPYIGINTSASSGELYLNHVFEGRSLVTDYIPAVLRGLVYFWGNDVKLETTEFEVDEENRRLMLTDPDAKPDFKKIRVLYTMYARDKRLERSVIS